MTLESNSRLGLPGLFREPAPDRSQGTAATFMGTTRSHLSHHHRPSSSRTRPQGLRYNHATMVTLWVVIRLGPGPCCKAPSFACDAREGIAASSAPLGDVSLPDRRLSRKRAAQPAA
jgi:hypothetical protein